MRVQEIMTQPAVTCRPTDSLNEAAGLMWDYDCGVLPVVDDGGVVVGLVTDRDVCMAAYTQGERLGAIRVATAMSKKVFSCRPDDMLEAAERTMSERKVRRLPVIDGQGRPLGVLSLNDIARHAVSGTDDEALEHELSETLSAICEPRRRALQSVPEPAARDRRQPAPRMHA